MKVVMGFFDKQLQAGDHLITERLGYTHHGIYLGRNKVIHYSGLAAGLRAGPVEITDWDNFSQGKRTYVKQHQSRMFSRRQTIKRARSRLSEDKYNLLSNNCEHFINWCIYGKSRSEQVSKVAIYLVSQGLFGGTISSFSLIRVVGKTAFRVSKHL